MPKLVRSYALDEIDPRFATEASTDQPSVRDFLSRLEKVKYQEADAGELKQPYFLKDEVTNSFL